MDKKIETIDTYIAQFPLEKQVLLKKIRSLIKEIVPEAKEAIKYAMPTFILNGNLIHFAAFKNHIGLYPTPSPIEAFKDKLVNYQTSKGAIQFPINKPMPYDLIKEIVKFRVEQQKATI